LVFVEVPPPGGGGDGEDEEIGVGEMLGRYAVREVALRRWLVSRNRD
jgi:tRNA-splicing endonuclease subunit Sen2